MARPVTRAALSKYERGEVVPRADVLADVARVLELPPTHFLASARQGGIAIRWLAYRKHAQLGARQQRRIRARSELLGEAFVRLIEELEPVSRPVLPDVHSTHTPEEAEAAAARLRSHWSLGDGPVTDLVARAEDAGVIVLGWNDDGGFDAASGWIEEHRPIVVLNLERPAERRRFVLAHELGHLVLDTAGVPPAEEEQLMQRFAAALLVPAAAARRELGARRRDLAQTELEHLKRKYGVSMQAWTRRARDLGIVTEETYRAWQIWFRSQGLHVRESVDDDAAETPARLRLLFVRALAERLVDRTWARALCPEAVSGIEAEEEGGPMALLRAPAETRRQLLEHAAAEAAEDYEVDPEVADFLDFHDDEPEA